MHSDEQRRSTVHMLLSAAIVGAVAETRKIRAARTAKLANDDAIKLNQHQNGFRMICGIELNQHQNGIRMIRDIIKRSRLDGVAIHCQAWVIQGTKTKRARATAAPRH